MLEEHRKEVSEAAERIRWGETIYTEAVEVIYAMWEVLLDNETVEKIKEDAWQDDLKITTVKVDMKKLPIKERSVKVSNLNQLQQEVKTLHDQEQKRNDEIIEH